MRRDSGVDAAGEADDDAPRLSLSHWLDDQGSLS
jgi:hypothetical protein